MTDPISRLNAALEGRYAIEREIGQGGGARFARYRLPGRQNGVEAHDMSTLRAELVQDRFWTRATILQAVQIPNWKVWEYFIRIVRSLLKGRTGSKEFRSVTRPSFQTM